jgi:D-alanyl-D-alanine carboxypeptidase (penicillin-binding protein 5/6)
MLVILLTSLLMSWTAAPVLGQTKAEKQPVLDPIPGLVSREHEIRAGLLYDVSKNTIVWEKDMHYAYPIASLTKMMVALLAMEDILAEKRDWSDEITVTRSYKKSPRSRKVITTQETYTLEGLVQLAMIPSNNLACADIAKHLNGSIENFVLRMNQRAISLGMNSTFYSNPSGLPGLVKEIDNSASPRDLLKLALELLKHEDLIRITSIGYAEISNGKGKGVHRNHNRLVIDYDEHVDGLKTGYTKRAGFCLAATSNKDDVRLISIVLGAPSSAVRNEIVGSMLNNYYSYMGCGPMKPSNPVWVPPSNPVVAAKDSGVVYKTVWAKQKKTHRVKSGESLSIIAQKYNCTYTQLKRWNGLKSDRIQPGQQLSVQVNVKKTIAIKPEPKSDDEDASDSTTPSDPDNKVIAADSSRTNTTEAQAVSTAKKQVSDIKPSAKKQPAKITSKVKYVYHTVQPGDTLWDIARKYKGISPEDIRKTNNLGNANSIKPGTRLKIKIGG